MGPDGFITTSGHGYVPNSPNPYDVILSMLSGGLPKDSIRQRLYNNIRPVGYGDTAKESVNKVINATKYNKSDDRPFDIYRDDIWAQYLGIPNDKRRSVYKLRKSLYKPTKNADNVEYYSLPLSSLEKDYIVEDAMNTTKMPDKYIDTGRPNYMKAAKELPALFRNQNKLSESLSHYLGTHTVGRGTDSNRGDYVSYYDRWDLSPIGYYGGDLSGTIGTPVNIYDRIYLDDYYGIDSSARPGTYYGGYLPEVTIKPRKK